MRNIDMVVSIVEQPIAPVDGLRESLARARGRLAPLDVAAHRLKEFAIKMAYKHHGAANPILRGNLRDRLIESGNRVASAARLQHQFEPLHRVSTFVKG